MTSDQLAIVGLGATVVTNIAALAWGASKISTTVSRLDRTLEKVVDSHATEAQRNAVQDSRLDDAERRLDSHDREIEHLWREQ